MRKLAMLAAAGFALSLLGSWPAAAADLAVKPVLKAPAATPRSMTQFYIGISALGAMTRDHVDFLSIPGQEFGTGNLNPAGFGVGGTVGVQSWTSIGNWLALEADVHYLFQRAGVQCLIIQQCTINNSWTGSVVGKFGAPLGIMTGQITSAVPANLPVPITVPQNIAGSAISLYIAGGARWRNVSACIDGILLEQGCSNTVLWGWTAGGGIQVPVSANAWLDLSVMYDRYNHAFIPGDSTVQPQILAGTWKFYDGVTAKVAAVVGF